MTRTLIDTDDELLERARALLGIATKKDTARGGSSAVSGRHERVVTPDRPVADAALSPLIEAGQVGVTLLHYDHEYDLIASVRGQPMHWIAPRGTADAPQPPSR